MKFTTAVLLQSSAVAASAPWKAGAGGSFDDPKSRMFLNKVKDGSKNSHDGNKIRQLLQEKQQQRRGADGPGGRQLLLQQSQNSDMRRRQLTKNNNNILRPVLTECSPHLGILACGGVHEYCIPNMESASGGYCMDFSGSNQGSNDNKNKNTRFLQDEYQTMVDDIFPDENYNNNGDIIYGGPNCTCYYNPGHYYYYNATNVWESAYYNYCKRNSTYTYRDCTCSNVDREQYTLTAQCTSRPWQEGCYTAYSSCGVSYEKCSEDNPELRPSYSIDIEGEGSISREHCSPKNGMDVCYGSSITIGQPDVNDPYSYQTYSLDSCSVKVNGEMCNSCEVVNTLYDNHCKYYTDPSYNCTAFNITCMEFDCENTDWNRKGSTCNYTYYPSSTYGCDTECNVCGAVGDDAAMTLPDENLTIPFYWSTMTCAESQRRAKQGALTSDGCASLQLLASETCGCEAAGGSSRKRSPGVGGSSRKRSAAEAVLVQEQSFSAAAPAGADLVAAAGLASAVAIATTWLVAIMA